MARAHVLDANSAGQGRVVWHFTTPAGNNSAGIPWTTALANSALRSVTTLVDGTGAGGTISAAEKAALLNGTAYENVELVDIPAGLTAVQADAFLDALHAAKQTEIFAVLERQLRYFGYTRV